MAKTRGTGLLMRGPTWIPRTRRIQPLVRREHLDRLLEVRASSPPRR